MKGMLKKLLSPTLADVICKVNWKQPLLQTEEFVYVEYLEKIADAEARRIIRNSYEEGKSIR